MPLDFKLDLPQTAGLQIGEEKGNVFDVAILGGGPAGMTAAVYVARKQLDTVIISPDLGGQVLWTSGVENYMGYQYITGPELSKKFSEQIQQFPLKLANGERAIAIHQQDDGLFRIQTDTERIFLSRTLILATGKRSRELGVPGELAYRGRGVSYCSICDGPFFKEKKIVIAGGGNSAVTSAIDMVSLKSPVTMVNFVKGWQADPVLMEQVLSKVQLFDNHRIVEIVGDGTKLTGVKLVSRDGGEEQFIDAEGVFIEIGLLPNTEFIKDFVSLNKRGEIIADCSSQTSRPGVYAAGDCTSVPEKQIIIAAGDGAKAALAAHRFLKNSPQEEV